MTAFLPFFVDAAPAGKGKATKAKVASVAKSDELPKIANLDEIAKELRLDRFKDRKFNRKIKIAIFDNGFVGHEKEIGKTLPADTKFDPGPRSRVDTVQEKEIHGTVMAVLLAQAIKKAGAESDYELHLFRTQGFTKFQAAIEKVSKGNFDLVLHSQVWEYSGHGDGKGYVNAAVNQAINSGVVWINAAGNFGKLTYVGPIETDGGWLKLYQKAEKKKTTDGIRLKCNARQNCKLRLVVTWNDVKEEIGIGTLQDLDFFVCQKVAGCDAVAPEELGKNVKVQGKLVQKESVSPNEEGVSLYSRELGGADLPPGTYFVRIKNNSKNFNAKSFVRVTASGAGIEIPDFVANETILPPADNPQVISVGASDHIHTSRSNALKRPDVNFKSRVVFSAPLKIEDMPSTTEPQLATSGAAALAAALAVLHLGIDTDKKKETLVTSLRMVSKTLPAYPGKNDLVAGTPDFLAAPSVTEQPIVEQKDVAVKTIEPKEESTPPVAVQKDVAPKTEAVESKKEATPPVAVQKDVAPKTEAVEPKKEVTPPVAVQKDVAPKTEAVEPKKEVTAQPKKDMKVEPVKKTIPPPAPVTKKVEAIKTPQKQEPVKAPKSKESVKTPVKKAEAQKVPARSDSADSATSKKKPVVRPVQNLRDRPQMATGHFPRYPQQQLVLQGRPGGVNCAQPAVLPVLHAGVSMVRQMDPGAIAVRWAGRLALVVRVDVRRFYRMNSNQGLFATDQGYAILTREYVQTHRMQADDYLVLQSNEVEICR